MVELSTLQRQKHGGEGLQSYQPVEGEGGGGVVCAVVEGRNLVMLPLAVTVLEVFSSGWIEGAYGFAQVTEVVW